jgi:signal transduction histidine kinase
MSREDSQRIMEPFFTTRIDRGGTGLGLSISESIVKEHGGRLEFTSVPGQGTTFAVRIPAAKG